MQTFGEHLREIRIGYGWTQTEIGRMICPDHPLPLRTTQDWESGARTPPPWVQDLIISRLSVYKVLKP